MLLGLIRASGEEAVCQEIPFEFREGLLWIKASMPKSAEPLNLLLDTGAGVSVLNSRTAERVGLKWGRLVRVQGVGSSAVGHWLQSASVSAAGVHLPGDFLAVDLEKLSRACTQRVDGLIGADFFQGQIVQIDFEKHIVRILSIERAPTDGEAIRLEPRRCGMRIPVSVNGGTSKWVRLDTGCASALQWVTSKVRQEQCGQKAAIGLAELWPRWHFTAAAPPVCPAIV